MGSWKDKGRSCLKHFKTIQLYAYGAVIFHMCVNLAIIGWQIQQIFSYFKLLGSFDFLIPTVMTISAVAAICAAIAIYGMAKRMPLLMLPWALMAGLQSAGTMIGFIWLMANEVFIDLLIILLVTIISIHTFCLLFAMAHFQRVRKELRFQTLTTAGPAYAATSAQAAAAAGSSSESSTAPTYATYPGSSQFHGYAHQVPNYYTNKGYSNAQYYQKWPPGYYVNSMKAKSNYK